MTPVQVYLTLTYSRPTASELAQMATDCMRVGAYAIAWRCLERMWRQDRERAERGMQVWQQMVEEAGVRL